MSLAIGACKQTNESLSAQAIYLSSGALFHRIYITFTWTQRHIREARGRKEI